MCGCLAQWTQAIITGIGGRDALRMTSPTLDAMISQAWAIRQGAPMSKTSRTAVADYYTTLDAIRAKMAKAKTNTDTQDTTNG